MTIYKNNEFSEDTKRIIAEDVYYKRFLGDDYIWSDFEDTVARCMHGTRKKSNTGLTDIYNNITAWSAKTLRKKHPFSDNPVDIISGRIDIRKLYKIDNLKEYSPHDLAKMILDMWNSRVNEAKAKYNDIRTIILLRSYDLKTVSFYEEETSIYNVDDYDWIWTKDGIIYGMDKVSNTVKLKWYPSGNHFRIISIPPKNRINLEIDYNKRIIDVKKIILEGFSFKQVHEIKQEEFNLV